MLRTTLLFALLLTITSSLHAQKHVYDDLLILYVDEEYEKCLWKADRYIEKDDTRRDPLPYLYMSMCSHEMSKLEKYTLDPEYRKVGRDALKYAEKFRKKDKNLEFFNNYEDYWAELNTVAMDIGLALLDQGEYSKAKRQFDHMAGYYPENPGAWQMLALCQLKMKLARDAKESMMEFNKAYAAVPDIDRLPKDQKRLLREGLIRYSEYLDSKGMVDSARTTIALGAEHFDENAEFRSLREQLN
ncbi:MAG: tetratricopeptide repeat protein [Flavobacteriales bacterium]|nr:hypothetical protein [Flavobacteriales bacterium]